MAVKQGTLYLFGRLDDEKLGINRKNCNMPIQSRVAEPGRAMSAGESAGEAKKKKRRGKRRKKTMCLRDARRVCGEKEKEKNDDDNTKITHVRGEEGLVEEEEEEEEEEQDVHLAVDDKEDEDVLLGIDDTEFLADDEYP
ncbi:hypothetical protein MKZ38_006277 [Zalerion maritima]|uniref:Uncharacterized protein n=1 Tax=Zalerion maritima TaxID=339359 RepID=A0AAD5WNI3_9PEZI|nr:hypothetical protein MKZ38_006277 [Zalerion maritima]